MDGGLFFSFSFFHGTIERAINTYGFLLTAKKPHLSLARLVWVLLCERTLFCYPVLVEIRVPVFDFWQDSSIFACCRDWTGLRWKADYQLHPVCQRKQEPCRDRSRGEEGRQEELETTTLPTHSPYNNHFILLPPFCNRDQEALFIAHAVLTMLGWCTKEPLCLTL
jgi:hypothetical protein